MEITFKSYEHYVARAERYLMYDINDGKGTETDLDYLTMLASCTHDKDLASAVDNVSGAINLSYDVDDTRKTLTYVKYQFILAHQKSIARDVQYPAGL